MRIMLECMTIPEVIGTAREHGIVYSLDNNGNLRTVRSSGSWSLEVEQYLTEHQHDIAQKLRDHPRVC